MSIDLRSNICTISPDPSVNVLTLTLQTHLFTNLLELGDLGDVVAA